MAAIPEESWGILPTSDSSYEKWLNGTRTFDPAVWHEIAEKYKEDRFLEIVIKELNDGVLVTVMDRFGIKVATVNEIDKELFIVAIGQQFHEIAKGSGSAENIVKNVYENTESKEIFPVYKQKALAEYSKVKTNFSDELCDMEEVFICNTLSTVDSAYSRRGLPARGTVIQDATLDKIAEQSNMVALIANGGMGKSMMLRHLFVESMKKYSETGVMPILVELRDYRFAGCDLFSSIMKSVNLFDSSFNEAAADKVLRAGKCQILLDGLDEVDPSDVIGFQHKLRDMIKTYPLNQYVITSRECDVAKSIGFRSRLYLMPFDEKQTSDLIDKLIRDDDAIIGEKVFDQSTQKYSLNLRKVERDKVERLEGSDFVLTDDAGKVITFGYEYKADMSQLEKRLARYMALFTLIKSDEVIKKKYERLKAYYDELVEKHRNNEF